MNGRIVVTGAKGFIGTHTVKALKNKGYEVVEVDLRCNPPIDFTTKQFKNVVHEGDKVLHLGAISTFSAAGRNPQLAVRVNVEGTLNVILACIEKKAERLVFASTGSVYAKYSPIPIREDAPREPRSIYGLSKKQAEDWVFLFGEKLPYIILRYGYVYGAGKDWGAIGNFIKRIRRNQSPIIFGGKQTNDFVYVKDVVQANLLALESEYTNQVYNIGTGVAVSIRQACELCLKAMQSNLKIKVEPPRPFDIPMFVYDITRARLLLGYEPKWKLADGIKDMIRELK